MALVTDTAIGAYIAKTVGRETANEWHNVDVDSTKLVNKWLQKHNIGLTMLDCTGQSEVEEMIKWEISAEDAQKLENAGVNLHATVY